MRRIFSDKSIDHDPREVFIAELLDKRASATRSTAITGRT